MCDHDSLRDHIKFIFDKESRHCPFFLILLSVICISKVTKFCKSDCTVVNVCSLVNRIAGAIHLKKGIPRPSSAIEV